MQIIKAHTLTLPSEKKRMKKKCLGRVTKTEKTEKTPTTTSTSTKEKVSIWFFFILFYFFHFIFPAEFCVSPS